MLPTSPVVDTYPVPNCIVTLKRTLHELLTQGRIDQIAEKAAHTKRVLGTLIPLTYDHDPEISWRAIEAMGAAAQKVAGDDANYVREHLRKLYWLLSEESGGVCWRAPEAMAEIVSREPTLFADYIPIVVFLIVSLAEEDLEHFRGGALWAIGRLGSVAGDSIAAVLPAVNAALDDPDPQIRGMAVWCLGQIGQADILADRPELLSDEDQVDLYANRRLKRTTLGQLARSVLNDRPDNPGRS